MIDCREYITIPKNIDLEKTIIENQSIRLNNKVLVAIAVTSSLIIIGVSIYYAHKLREEEKKYTTKASNISNT